MLDKRISFIGFELEEIERKKVDALVENYIKKIEKRISDYEDFKIRLKKSLKGKAFLHEIEVDFILKGKRLTSKGIDYNIYKAISIAFEGILREIENTIRKFP